MAMGARRALLALFCARLAAAAATLADFQALMLSEFDAPARRGVAVVITLAVEDAAVSPRSDTGCGSPVKRVVSFTINNSSSRVAAFWLKLAYAGVLKHV